MKPVVFGCAGTSLTSEEKSFFSEAQPFGFILFQRNCESPAQVRRLVEELRGVTSDETPVFIDQEGGRVARLKPPHWPALPPLRSLGRLYEREAQQGLEAARLHARITAHMLTGLGINGNCAPVLDLYIEGASSAIGDRALSRDPEIVAALAGVIIDTYLDNGVLPVVKHLPGHGRVKVDPHVTLPVVDTLRDELHNEDFKPFLALHDAPIGMNCHVVFSSLDDQPVSMSAKIHQDIIRGLIGFQGLIFSDDLDMKALNGSLSDLANKALRAGADIALYCAGHLTEMRKIAAVIPHATDRLHARRQAILQRVKKPKDYADFQQDIALLGNMIC